MGFEFFDFVLLTNHSRGLAVLWNNHNIHASILGKESKVIYMLVHDTIQAQNSIISEVYDLTQ